MIILRNSERLFSDRIEEINQVIEAGHTYSKEIMKALELYWDDPNDINHWVDKASGYIFKDTYNKQFIKPHYCFLDCLSNNEILNLVGENSLNTIRGYYKEPVDFIQSVKFEILIEKGGKYKTWIKTINDFKISNKEYLNIFRFISLCISGKVLFDDWNNKNLWINKQVSKTSNLTISTSIQLKSIIIDCIESILGLKY